MAISGWWFPIYGKTQNVSNHQPDITVLQSQPSWFDRGTALVGGVHNSIACEALHRPHADAKTSQWQRELLDDLDAQGTAYSDGKKWGKTMATNGNQWQNGKKINEAPIQIGLLGF